jgi:hypothetical protein
MPRFGTRADERRAECRVFAPAKSRDPGWGNGTAAATRLRREGATVACADLNEAAAEQTAGINLSFAASLLDRLSPFTRSLDLRTHDRRPR